MIWPLADRFYLLLILFLFLADIFCGIFKKIINKRWFFKLFFSFLGVVVAKITISYVSLALLTKIYLSI